jgi:DNA mismatch repair protein MutL
MIRVLPESLVNKIAAGEVIVRPASVVKELVENALDAGASRITVDVGNDCRDIRVADDGAGMTREDAHLALVRHATSKIADFEDLWALDTRGFRGEALASIGAVSRIQVLTRRRGDVAGTRIVAGGAGEPLVEAAGAPEGTEVKVRELFFNTPARLKFLKSAAAELQAILAIITRQALIRPDIGFAVNGDKGALLDLPPGQPWDDRVSMLLGSGTRENLLDVAFERQDVRVRGFILRPAATRKDRRHQFFFVNGRPISSRSLSFAVQEAYRGVIMVQRFPIVVLDVAVPAGEVDVNVHPTKEEVRFRRESLVNGAIHRAVRERLARASLLPTIQFEPAGIEGDEIPYATARPPSQDDFLGAATEGSLGGAPPAIPVDFGLFTARAGTGGDRALAGLEREADGFARAEAEFQATAASVTAATAPKPPVVDGECDVRPVSSSVRRLQEQSDDSSEPHPLARLSSLPEPLGQVSLCYIVARAGHDLLLIDQHAAHERLLYLRFSAARSQPPTQPLLIPVSVDIPASATPFMQRLLPVMAALGMQTEHFGGQTYVVHSVPADLPNMDPGRVLADMLDDIETLGKVEEVGILRDRVITRMACRSAVKAGQELHRDEMAALIRDIVTARLAFTCPHGRPTMVMLTRDQLDRQFKRKL